MKKITKMINLTLLLIMLFSTIFPVAYVYAENAAIEYHGKIRYGYSTVGDFTVNGVQAFCIDHVKPTPPTGTNAEIEISHNTNIAKCLYYGWGGAEQWSGFTSREMGIVVTSLALDHFNNGSDYSDSRDFVNYINSVDMPDIILEFNNRNLTAYATDNNMQRTDSTTVTGSSEYFLTLNLQDGVTLVNETRGTESTGSANIYGGDTFFLKAPMTVNGRWTSNNIDNCKYKFQPIVYRVTNSSLQDLSGGLHVQVDPGTTTNLNVNWLNTGNLIIHKVDETNNSIVIPNTSFDIYDSSNNLIRTVTTDNSGIARVNDITIGEYKLIETSTNEYYNVNSNPRTITVSTGNTDITITNKKKVGYIEINKFDEKDNSIKLANVKFGIYDTKNNLIETLTTNTNGYAKSSSLDLEKHYTVKELSTQDNYILNKNIWNIDLTENGIVDGYIYTLNVGNKHKTGNLVIYKTDADDNKIAIADTVFDIFNSNNDHIATIKTDSKGIARLDNINIGTYTIIEKSTNEFYNLNTEKKTLIVKDSSEYGDSNITITNKKKVGYIEINKFDEENNSIKLSNIKFGIYDAKNNLVETLITNTNGYVKSSALDLSKKYIVKELETQENYILNKNVWNIDLIENGIVDKFVYTLNIGNEYKKGNLVIHKVDADNNKIYLENVSFKIYDKNKNYISTITTDNKGVARLDNINIGTYTIVEESTNEFYVLNTQEYTTNVKWEKEFGDTEITITNNKKTGYIEINKYDIENNNIKLANVKFGIYDTKNKLIETLTTDKNGYAKSSPLYLDQKYIVKELETLDTYVLNKTEWKVNLTENGIVDQFIYTLNIENEYKKGNLVIRKIDADDNKILIKNASFKVYDENKKCIATIKTNEKGIARLDNINIGTYTIVEDATNEFYRLDTNEHTINIKWSEKYGDTITNITNERKVGYIEISKYDTEIYEKHNKFVGVSNVIFGIFDNKGNKIQEITTDSNGYAKSKELPLINKNYVVKELKTRDEYIINETEFKVNLIENGVIDEYVYTLKVGNTHKKGNLHIEKITKDDKNISLGNVEFELYLVGNGEINLYIDTYYTDVNGEIYIENLNTGNYILKETLTNRWYYLADDTPIEIKWSEEFGDTNVTIENEQKKGIIKVIKTDKDFSIALENIKFNIYDEYNNFIETITTNSVGVAESSRLRIDKKYKLVESETLNNYILDNTIHTIDFTENLTKDEINNIQEDIIKTLKLQNQHKKGNLVVYKVDTLDNKSFIPGVTFELYSTKVDKPYEPNELIETYITDSEGKIEINNLWTGNYLLKETKTDVWHKLNTDDIKLEIKANETTSLTIKNDAKRGYIVIEKQDSEFSNIKLQGVTFNIYDEDAKLVETITTDKNGIAKSSLLKIDKTYYVSEISTNNSYILSNEFIKVNFTENLNEKEIAEITTDIEFKLNIENEAKTSSLEIIKIDKDNNKYRISDVTFEIFDETLKKVVGTVKTDKNGCATIDNLKVTHTYSVTEKISNKKYKLNDTPITNIVLTPDKITSITFENEKIKGQVRIIKVDKDDNTVLLPGIEFEILNINMETIETLITNENGEALSSKLPAIDETYYIKEKRTNDIYVLSNEIKEIVLKEDEITDMVFENEKKKGTITIIKVDKDNADIKLAGAVFGIYNENNELISTITTNDKGEVTSEKLILGKYFIKELDTGSVYYLLNDTIYDCEIKENNENILLQIENEGTDIKVDVDKEGTIEIKPEDNVNYTFSNIQNLSNVYLENFKWFDYIPTDYVRLEKMTTGTWNQELNYNVYYKTNKSEDYILFKEKLNTNENYDLDFTELEFTEDEYIIETCFDFGKVDTGFKENISPTMQCKSLDNLNDNDTFTNYTKTVGTYFGISAEAHSKWTTIVHKPKEYHEPVLPKTGK